MRVGDVIGLSSFGFVLCFAPLLAAAEPRNETALIAAMKAVSDKPPKGKGLPVCTPLNDLYFEAARFFQAAKSAQPQRSVSSSFLTYWGRLGRIRKDKECPHGARNDETPTSRDVLISVHNDLVAKLRLCTTACQDLEDALMVNLMTAGDVLKQDDPELARIFRDVAIGIPGDKLAEELVRKVRSGQVSAKELLDIARSVMTRAAKDGRTSPMLAEIAEFLKRVEDPNAVPDVTIRELFGALISLAANKRLSPENLRGLLNDLRAIVSDDDLIHLGEALTLRKNVRTSEDWKTLYASVKLLVDIHPELRQKLYDKLPAELPAGAAREQTLLAVADLLTNAQLVELNRLRAGQTGVSVEPERLRKLRLLVVMRPAPECAKDAAPPACAISKELLRGVVVALGTNPDSVSIVDVPGEFDEVARKAAEALKWDVAARKNCERKIWGALCEWPYGGVVIVGSRLDTSGASAQAAWRIRDGSGDLISAGAETKHVEEAPQAFAAGSVLGVEALREGTLWKMLLKELPVPTCVGGTPPVVAGPPAWRRWTRAGLVIATAGSLLGAVYTHNTSPASSTDDVLWKVGLVSLTALAGFEGWDLLGGGSGAEKRP